MKNTHLQPAPGKIRFTESALARLIRIGWVTDSVEDGVQVRTIAIPEQCLPQEEDLTYEDWPELIGD